MTAPARLPLADEDLERALIGACMLDPAVVAEVMHVRPDDLADPRRAAIWVAMRELAGSPFSASSLVARMGALCTTAVRDELRDSEAGAYSTSGVCDTADRLAELGQRRRLARAARRILEAAGSAIVSTAELRAQAFAEVLDATSGSGKTQPVTYGGLLAAATEQIQENRASRGGLTGATTGLPTLDAMTSGMHPAELWLLAARPGCGKTALAMSIAHAVARQGKPVAFASLEMPLRQLGVRCLASTSGVSQGSMRRGTFSDREMAEIAKACDDTYQLPIVAWDEFNIDLGDLRRLALHTRGQFGGLGLVIVDYLQLMRTADSRAPRHEQVAALSRGLKGLSKELSCPVLALSQLSREGVKSGRRPVLSDLRESGSLEQDADTVLFLHRDDDEAKAAVVDVELIIGKQRNGPLGSLDTRFAGATMRFEEKA